MSKPWDYLIEASTAPRLKQLLTQANMKPGDARIVENLFNVAKRMGLSLYVTFPKKRTSHGFFRGVYRIEKVGPIPEGQYTPLGSTTYKVAQTGEGKTGFLMTPIAPHGSMIKQMEWFLADEFAYFNPIFGVKKSGGYTARLPGWPEGEDD